MTSGRVLTSAPWTVAPAEPSEASAQEQKTGNEFFSPSDLSTIITAIIIMIIIPLSEQIASMRDGRGGGGAGGGAAPSHEKQRGLITAGETGKAVITLVVLFIVNTIV